MTYSRKSEECEKNAHHDVERLVDVMTKRMLSGALLPGEESVRLAWRIKSTEFTAGRPVRSIFTYEKKDMNNK